MKKILFLLLLSTNVLAQQQGAKYSFNDFMLIEKVEDQEAKYKAMLKELSPEQHSTSVTNDFRGELTFAWLNKGNVERYRYYKSTNPEFSGRQYLYLVNALEKLFDEGKDYKSVETISKELLEEIEKGTLDDLLGRAPVMKELNAAANAKLGNVARAKEMMGKLSSEADVAMRDIPYFKDSKSNYINRYAMVLLAEGKDKDAFELLTKAFKDADSNPYMLDTFKEAYKKTKGSDQGFETYLIALQKEAYQHYYQEVEKLYIASPQQKMKGELPSPDDPTEMMTLFEGKKPVQEITLENLKGEPVRLADHTGKILVVDFWTTLCTPCVAAFTGFERVVADYNKADLQLFVINLFETDRTVKAYVAQKGITLDVLRDEENLAYNVQGTPTKIIFDPSGNIRFYAAGYAGSTDREYYKLKAMVEITKARAVSAAMGE
ncbi:Thiol-disulfide isomerase or thioredoxin [Sphingobacterium nematocida]|uniref:Thiol-disulfide isomerase or thioredoxin n=1 Tax=Sphingobacterium nematocida TaxID=1513896 RepID=A0A1T5AWV3_9SPHI|nr:TlpA disulfide reductase family protein [Sphingobacterium nematocida]SKB39468.1 Thiol-disulfide isomerase or thioredoxin [Sphingobacterium nematocida]